MNKNITFEAERVTPENRHFIFELSDQVIREQVYYKTRYGVEVAADFYYAKDLDKNVKHPAVVVGPPLGGVKEQGPGVYANELAKRGFVAIAFDPAYHGESGGYPRYTASPDTYMEDFSAAVDYLGTVDFVEREKIAAIGICASGGFSLGAAAQDARIKAVVTSVLYDIPGLAGMATGEDRRSQLEAHSRQRWEDFEEGTAKFSYDYPEQPQTEMLEGLPILPEFFDFYGTKRGWHEHARANITAASNLTFMNYQATGRIEEISPRPVLMITSEEAHSKGFTDALYPRLGENKELVVLEKGMHVDFYDRTDIIPFDKIEEFLKKSLA